MSDRNNFVDQGLLRLHLTSRTTGNPIENARINISYTGDPGNPIETITSNNSGYTESVSLRTPPLEYSMAPSEQQPYSEYTISVTIQGYTPITISGINVLSGETSIQEVQLDPMDTTQNPIDTITIGAHTLYGNYPAKIPEEEIKPVPDSGEIVLSRVVIPEYVIVHDGSPNDSTAANYYIRYKDYIKNVASSEIYSTWPDATLRANILAIMSFTLNRVYTEW